MSVRDVVQAAAGALGGGEALYAEDVFSTYLYTGNGSTQVIENGIALGDSNYGPSVEFDGTNDYLSTSSDLTGNTDSKTFTFSMWVYRPIDQNEYYYEARTTGGLYRFFVSINTAEEVRIVGKNSGGTTIFDYSTNDKISYNTWTHILLSIDLANTSNRQIYINDAVASATYLTYTNDSIAFSGGTHSVGANGAGSSKVEGRLSHVFLDYTYRDLSVESNRRLFITSGGEPATGLSSLSPILYMPLDGTTASIGTNSGTGGDFTVNGSPTVLTQGGPYTESGYGQGGLVWIKDRDSGAKGHALFDTERGGDYKLQSQSTGAQFYATNQITSFNADGFTLGSAGDPNGSGTKYTSWTWRKAPKFFDVVTYTGNGVDGRTVSHNLESEPGCIIVKRTDSAAGWIVYHRSSGAGKYLRLDGTGAEVTSTAAWNNTSPTSTVFSVGTNSGTFTGTNASGGTYVAYLFAHEAGGFGADGTEDVISCGSYTGSGSVDTITLGWEPQFILTKKISGTGGNWVMLDTMRGLNLTNELQLYPNLSNAESALGSAYVQPTATGFTVQPGYWGTGETVIYIAIRRPMKTPTAGTEVFSPLGYTGDGSASRDITGFGFPADLVFHKVRGTSGQNTLVSRLQGVTNGVMATNSTNAESGSGPVGLLQDGITTPTNAAYWEYNSSGYEHILHVFRRAPSFFDVVCDTGTGTTHTINHNLGVAPELLIRKRRSAPAENWLVLPAILGASELRLNQTGALSGGSSWNNTLPTATVFTVGSGSDVNGSGYTYVNYLFATLSGVSKVGSYTGTAADLNVDCGFSAGARFILIKRTDSTGDWYVWDSARGIVAGNDPYLLLNSTAAEVTSTDYIDPYSAGFTVTSSAPAALNASGGTYIFLAIA